MHQRPFTSGNLELDSPLEDRWLVGSLELAEEEVLVDRHHMLLAARIQHLEDMADQTLTFAELVEPPLAVVQISHHVCPFQLCVVSAN